MNSLHTPPERAATRARLVIVPGLHGSEGAHWQTWLERQFARSLRVEQADWDAPDVAVWAKSLRDLLARERGPFVLAAHSLVKRPPSCSPLRPMSIDATRGIYTVTCGFVVSVGRFMFSARFLQGPSVTIGDTPQPRGL